MGCLLNTMYENGNCRRESFADPGGQAAAGSSFGTNSFLASGSISQDEFLDMFDQQ